MPAAFTSPCSSSKAWRAPAIAPATSVSLVTSARTKRARSPVPPPRRPAAGVEVEDHRPPAGRHDHVHRGAPEAGRAARYQHGPVAEEHSPILL